MSDETVYRVDPTAIVASLVVMSIIIGLAVVLSVWVFWHRKSPVVIAMQPEFLIILCVGIILSESTIIPLGRDATDTANIDMACMAIVWLYRLGSILTLSALFSKLWRVNQIFHAGEAFRRKVVTLKRVLWPFTIFLTLNLIFLITATVVDPFVWDRESNYGAEDHVGYCSYTGTVGRIMDSLLDLLDFGALLFLCFQAYRARDIRAEFSEARGVALALFSWLQIMIIAVPTFYLMVETDITARYVLLVLEYSMRNLSLLVFIFGPLVAHQRKFARGGGGDRLPIRGETHILDKTSDVRDTTGEVASYELRGAKRRIVELEAQVKALNSRMDELSKPASSSDVQGANDAADVQSHVNDSAETNTGQGAQHRM